MIKTHFRTVLNRFEAKQQRRITYTEVANLTGVTQKTVANWDNGDIAQIHTEVLDAFCGYFRCQPGDLISFEPAVSDGPTN